MTTIAELGNEVHILRLGNINLQARIRELEAELAENRKHHGWRKRAYDAEARVAELEEQRLFDSRNYEPEREAD